MPCTRSLDGAIVAVTGARAGDGTAVAGMVRERPRPVHTTVRQEWSMQQQG